MKISARIVGAAFLVLGCFTICQGEERFMRYRLLEPATPSVATVSAHSNVNLRDFPYSWGRNPMAGILSNKGLYITPGVWSPWRRLPSSPMWGDIGITLRGAEPIARCKVDVQVASWPEEKYIARSMMIENLAGVEVAFTLPPSILENPDLIETLPETLLRRRKIADAVAVPENNRPRLLRFCANQVAGDPSVANSEKFELETTLRLGLNTWMQRWLPGQYLAFATTAGSPELANQLKYSPEEQERLAFVMAEDEPAWYTGFNPVWAKTGETGFRDYLKEQGVTPESLGVKSFDEVRHIRRDQPVVADAPVFQRRLWHWSCRYTYAAFSQYFASVTKAIQAKLPNTPVSVNYQPSGMIEGAFGDSLHPDIFEAGRLNGVSMQFIEDWIFGTLNAWGKGVYQKVAYFADIQRGAARYQGLGPASLGFYPICIGWDPKGKETARNISMRINLLLSQGCKTFSFFNYGPTTCATVDYWADSAPIARGVADAIRMVGSDKIEPYLWAGMPVEPQVCMLYSVENFYWIESNKSQDDEYERQYLYCMLQQSQIPVDIIAGRDLNRFVGNYKVAYAVDRILVRKAAEDLKKWVEAGGVLVLGPGAVTKDEYNEPLSVFVNEPGKNRVGKGWVVRFKDREGSLWWKSTVELCGDTGWASAFDREHQDIICKPALELAGITRPVIVNVPGMVAEPLVSAKGVAIPLVNLLGLYEKGGTRVMNLKVTLVDGKGVTGAWSSRCGELPLRREGGSVAVVMPIEYADVLIFAK